MTLWSDVLWVLGGAVVGAPISAAMSTLPEPQGDGVSLKVARYDARVVTDWRVWDRFRSVFGSGQTRVRSSDDDVWVSFFLYALATLLIVRLYVENVVGIAVVLFWLSVLTLVVTAVVFFVLWWRNVFDGQATFWALVTTVPFACVGSVVAYWLIDPPLHGVVEPALAALAQGTILDLVPYLAPLVLQIGGALAAFFVLFASMALCTANVAAALIASEAWGARWLWRFVFWMGRWTTGRGAFVGFLILAAFAGVAASGWMAEWIEAVQRSLPTPSSS